MITDFIFELMFVAGSCLISFIAGVAYAVKRFNIDTDKEPTQ